MNRLATLSIVALAASAGLATGVQAAPMLQAQAYDGGLDGTPLTLATFVNGGGTLLQFGGDGNFTAVTISGSGVPSDKGLALTTLDAVATKAATLTIVLTQTGLLATSSTIPFAATFTANALTTTRSATFTFADYVSAANVAFDTNLADLVASGTLADVSGSTSAAATGFAFGLSTVSPYSETLVITVTFDGVATGSFSASPQLIPVPEPVSAVLLLTGLLAIVGVHYGRSDRTV